MRFPRHRGAGSEWFEKEGSELYMDTAVILASLGGRGRGHPRGIVGLISNRTLYYICAHRRTYCCTCCLQQRDVMRGWLLRFPRRVYGLLRHVSVVNDGLPRVYGLRGLQLEMHRAHDGSH